MNTKLKELLNIIEKHKYLYTLEKDKFDGEFVATFAIPLSEDESSIILMDYNDIENLVFFTLTRMHKDKFNEDGYKWKVNGTTYYYSPTECYRNELKFTYDDGIKLFSKIDLKEYSKNILMRYLEIANLEEYCHPDNHIKESNH